MINPISVAVALKYRAADAVLPILGPCLTLKRTAARDRSSEHCKSFDSSKIIRLVVHRALQRLGCPASPITKSLALAVAYLLFALKFLAMIADTILAVARTW